MTNKINQIAIIGGGIGGMCTALALHKVGLPVKVYEKATEIKEVGAGLAIWSNAIRVLDQLGVGEEIRQIGLSMKIGELCRQDGEVLHRTNIEPSETANYVLHRADLLAALANQIPSELIECQARCVNFSQDREGVTIYFKDREPVQADALIGADGLHSIVRERLWGYQPLRYSGQTAYRGIAPIPPLDPHIAREIHGQGQRAGLAPVDKYRVYWWVAFNAPAQEFDIPEQRYDDLLRKFKNWPFYLPMYIAATPKDKILRNDLVDRTPLAHWTQGRVTLLGDAAHPMLPNLGQGACSAIEDSLVLARALIKQPTIPMAFQAYEKERIDRTTQLVNESWQLGQTVVWENPMMIKLREAAIQLMPSQMIDQQIERQIGFDAGQLPIPKN